MQKGGQGADFKVSADEISAFQRDGYLIVRSLFSEEETALIRETMEQDPIVRGSMFDRTDDSGAATRAVVWLEPGESTYGLVARVRRVAETMSALLGHEVYHYQAKLTAKEPRKGGAWEWHQDFGYWYEQNCLYPDMGSMMLALDASNRENGGLQVLSGSHRMGLMKHVLTPGGQYCVDPDRLSEVEKVVDHVHCELEPGDALFFHCNTLHRSDQNRSDKRRWTLLACYNTKHNSPFKTIVPGTPYRTLDMAPDAAILSAGVRFATGEEQFQTKYVEEQKKADSKTVGCERRHLMGKVSMVMFDLSGTTVHDDTGVRDSLYKAAVEFKLDTTPDEILLNMGTNKIHLYQFLISRAQGKDLKIEDFEKTKDPDTYEEAKTIFDRYTEIMIDHYHNNVREVPGAVDTFKWCHDHSIKVATDTGFHRDVTTAIMDGLGWVKDGLVDVAVDVEHVPGERGRPAPFMIYHAMSELDVQNVHEVIKVGDTPADMLEGYNAGCRGIIGVLSGPRPVEAWGRYWHTHVISSVAELPELIESEFL